MTKHHAKHKKHNEDSAKEEAGFLSFDLQKFMSRKDKFLIVGVVLGVIALIGASLYIIVGRGSVDPAAEEEARVIELQNEVNAQIDERTSNVKDTTVLINPRAINPNSVTILAGGSVGFFNESEEAVELRGYDNGSEILNIGAVAPFDISVVVFDTPGVFKYINPANPDEIAEVVVK